MSLDAGGRTIAGADGCKAGWVAVTLAPGRTPVAAVYPAFAELVSGLPPDAIIAVDMPIGLPDFTNSGGRGPERLVRPLLGQRQSSVFSIPSRAAIYAEPGPFASVEEYYAAHRRASDVARKTSDPPRGVSIQAFGIFPKIREIDALLIERPDLRSHIFESHPEVAFCQLNGRRPMATPKKVKNRINPAGMEERRTLLASRGLPRSFLDQAPPRGAASDDFLDACAMLLIAARITSGEAKPLPNPPGVDSHGLPVAIWV